MSTTIAATTARAKLTEIIDEVERTNQRVIITKKGKAKVAVISIEELEGWEETFDILQNKNEVAAIRQGLADIKVGKVIRWRSTSN